jgi:Short C-terminal domain
MSPFGFHKKDRLAQPALENPVSAQALVVRGDPGYSAMHWWSASLRLQVTVPGQEPSFVEHECNAVREKTPLAGMVLPVEVERDDPTRVRISWEDVPTVDERIANRDPLILDPESAWRAVLDVDRTRSEYKPSWGDGQLAGWPASDGLRHGRSPGTALVIAHSGDPAGYASDGGFSPPGRNRYSYGGTVETGWHTFLGWMLLCVIPQDGDRYGLQLQTKVRRDRFGPVLPVATHPTDPADIEIPWDYAPEAPAAPSAGAQLANAIAHGGQLVAPDSDAAASVFAQIEDPKLRGLGEKMLGRLGAKGGIVVMSSGSQTAAPADRSATVAQLQELRDRGALTAEEYQAALAKLPPA